MTVKEFVNKYFDMAFDNEQKNKVPYLIILSQAALESGWGKHAPGNNFFGIKDSASANYGVQEKLTKEFINGQYITIKAKFETYPSAYECFEHHSLLLRRRWPKAFVHRYDPIKFIWSVQNEHKYKYATDPNYVEKINKIMKLIIREIIPLLKKKYEILEGDVIVKPLEYLKINNVQEHLEIIKRKMQNVANS
jgi:flagellum-specific peptidoglycan hydrolase FlgJ